MAWDGYYYVGDRVTLKQYKDEPKRPEGVIVEFKGAGTVAIIDWKGTDWFDREDGSISHIGNEWSIESLMKTEEEA